MMTNKVDWENYIYHYPIATMSDMQITKCALLEVSIHIKKDINKYFVVNVAELPLIAPMPRLFLKDKFESEKKMAFFTSVDEALNAVFDDRYIWFTA